MKTFTVLGYFKDSGENFGENVMAKNGADAVKKIFNGNYMISKNKSVEPWIDKDVILNRRENLQIVDVLEGVQASAYPTDKVFDYESFKEGL